MSPSRITIVGANGRLGRALQEACRLDFETLGTTRKHLDLSWSRTALRQALDPLETEVLLLAAANTNVDQCEANPSSAYQENATAVGHLAEWCADRGVRLVHFSTDYVFDGELELAHDESAPVSPVSVYGRSKREGEIAALAASDGNLVVRLSWLYGPGRPTATPDWVVESAVKQEGMTVVADKTGSPGYTRHVAAALKPLLFDEVATGILHLANRGACSWLDWAQYSIDCAVACGVRVKTRRLKPSWRAIQFAGKAERPRHTVLSTRRYLSLTGRALPDWRVGVEDYVRQFVAPRFLEAETSTPAPGIHEDSSIDLVRAA